MPVLLIGTYHMANPGLDGFNLEADDVLTPRRQGEIEGVVESLAQFRPTRVLVEAPADRLEAKERYHAYLAGEQELGRSEVEQIGFRLARRLGHPEIHPVDVHVPPTETSIPELVESEPRFGSHLAGLQAYGEAAMETLARWLEEGTVGEMLHRMNTPEALAWAHEVYLRFFPPLVAEERYAGADQLAAWYHRNLRIFSNLHRALHGPDERLFVLYGQGHVPILRRLVEESPWFCVEDPLGYLPAP